MNINENYPFEVIAMIGFREKDIDLLNKVQEKIIDRAQDRTKYFLVNEAMKARGKKFSRWIIGNEKLVDDFRLTVEIVRLNTPSQLYKDNG